MPTTPRCSSRAWRCSTRSRDRSRPGEGVMGPAGRAFGLIGLVAAFGQTPPTSEPSYVGSAACARCHAPIANRYAQTRMANVLRDPREHPEAIVGDFSDPSTVRTFTADQIA